MCLGVCVVINLFKIIACIVRDNWLACLCRLETLLGLSDEGYFRFVFVNRNVCTNTVGIGHACKLSIYNGYKSETTTLPIYIYIYIFLEYYKEKCETKIMGKRMRGEGM